MFDAAPPKGGSIVTLNAQVQTENEEIGLVVSGSTWNFRTQSGPYSCVRTRYLLCAHYPDVHEDRAYEGRGSRPPVLEEAMRRLTPRTRAPMCAHLR